MLLLKGILLERNLKRGEILLSGFFYGNVKSIGTIKLKLNVIVILLLRVVV